MAAPSPVDPLHTLQTALNSPANSQQQAEQLAKLRESLELQPAPIPILISTFLSIIIGNAGESLLKTWVIDLLHFAICRSTLTMEQKTQISSQSLDTLAKLLHDSNAAIVKAVVQCFATMYPLLFRFFCNNRSNPAGWHTLVTCKDTIIRFTQTPQVNLGVKLSSLKFTQRAILLQTRGAFDPRLQNKNDPNISNCPPDHPFISVNALEQEGQKLLETVITMLYSIDHPDLLSALLNSWCNLVKMRPAAVPFVVAALKEWTPRVLIEHEVSPSSVRSVEKAVRILLNHISRLPHASPYSTQIGEAMAQQAVRMEIAGAEEKKRKVALAAGLDPRKRTSEVERSDVKRVKLENEASSSTNSAAFLSAFDFTSLPSTLITDLVVANLEAFSEAALTNLVQTYRQSKGLDVPQLARNSAFPSQAPSSTATSPPSTTLSHAEVSEPTETAARSLETSSTPPPPAPVVKDEPVDPLQMDIDQDELEYEPDRLNEELSGSLPPPESQAEPAPDADPGELMDITPADFKLPSPEDLSEVERIGLLSKAFTRIWEESAEIMPSISTDNIDLGGPVDVWMLLLVRMITRVVEPSSGGNSGNEGESDAENTTQSSVVEFSYHRQDQLRRVLCDYIMVDFPARVRLATIWLNEEWYNDRLQGTRNPKWRASYDIWLNQIVAAHQTHLDGKERMFSRFLMDIPSVPLDILDLLRDLCVDHESSDRMQVGFFTLRGFVAQRPALRAEALNVLLELTTHSEKKTRGAAINTVKLWVPHSQPMDTMIRSFALQVLRKLQRAPARSSPSTPPVSEARPSAVANDADNMQMDGTQHKEDKQPKEGQDENMEDGQLPPEDLIQTPYLPERIELPAERSQVLQHVELLFALSVKVPEFLDELFSAYGQMDVTVQEAIQALITALIRSLGSSHSKLLTLMRNCPAGAESLALRVLTIFTENGRPSPSLVALVKSLINERDLDARFLIPVIAEMDKPDIIRHLPRIVSILNGQPEPKNLVRSVFSSVVTTPPQTFGSVTSNLPRVRQSELLTPAELMVLLHDSEKEIGLKSAIEAIGICFSMTDIFRSEILAVVMQQIVDEPTLPVLFLRTVIQAVTTYKSLVKFVSTTLLSRLITKKIWTNPPLWEGFIRCAKVIAPQSFGALLQLPKDQLRELVDKQPSLKAGLREFVTKKAPNKARVSGFLDIFAEADEIQSAPAMDSS
ncbi:hypothetical protein E1B28_007543 [Marasmius oreades]|uniref:Symplekin n=1 Tax=Marasmius oreades TaxID=181124 RepID=A0A9P7UU51_9AGAR|nr:uncharacterized protein E1B28_007543 [Marasmius oreades]KAG7093905.1 hypothetical protein E1B28_007543 [Marasmius oreades]